MSLSEIQTKNQRRAMLKLLSKMPDLSSSDFELREAVNDVEKINTSFDKFKSECAWLEEQGLVKIEGQVIDTIKLTQRGLDVAEYKVAFPGIAKKRPS